MLARVRGRIRTAGRQARVCVGSAICVVPGDAKLMCACGCRKLSLDVTLVMSKNRVRKVRTRNKGAGNHEF